MLKYFTGSIVVIAVLTTFNAFALEPLSSETMKKTTAAAGVSIMLDDIVIEMWTGPGSITYTDTDGNSDGNRGSIRIATSKSHRVVTIQAITGYDPETGELKSPGNNLVKQKK